MIDPIAKLLDALEASFQTSPIISYAEMTKICYSAQIIKERLEDDFPPLTFDHSAKFDSERRCIEIRFVTSIAKEPLNFQRRYEIHPGTADCFLEDYEDIKRALMRFITNSFIKLKEQE